MQAAAIPTNRFLTGYSSKTGFPDAERVVSNHDFLRHIFVSHLVRSVGSQQLFVTLINDLIQLAEQAYTRRDLGRLEEMSRILTNLPIDSARQIGLYYYALATKRKGFLDEAQILLESVADNAPLPYRARAIQSLGPLHYDRGKSLETVKLQLESLRIASDKNAHGLQTILMARGEIALVSGLAGDHKSSLAQFERLRPLVCQVAKRQPYYFYVYHNALAVELSETGRLDEAEAASRIALASPFAPAYPEWSETRDEIAAKRTAATPSIVSLNRHPEVPPAPRVEPSHSGHVESRRKPERSRDFFFSRPVNQAFFQIPLTPIAVAAAIIGILQSILDRMRSSIGPRAPPAFS